MALRKIDLMHKTFGREDIHKCGDCNHSDVPRCPNCGAHMDLEDPDEA